MYHVTVEEKANRFCVPTPPPPILVFSLCHTLPFYQNLALEVSTMKGGDCLGKQYRAVNTLAKRVTKFEEVDVARFYNFCSLLMEKAITT